MLGASALTFIVKGGTVAILAEAEAQAGPIERPPLRLAAAPARQSHAIEPFLAGCRTFSRRYVKLGACLLVAYTVTAVVYLGFLVSADMPWRETPASCLAGRSRRHSHRARSWSGSRCVNFLYLLTQMAIAVENLGVRQAMRRVAQFIRGSLREVAGIFGVVLLLVAITTIASILTTAGLGLIAVLPFVGLAMVPLQLAAWLLRGVIFEYLALTALGAYLTQYRYYLHGLATLRVHDTTSDVTGPRLA